MKQQIKDNSQPSAPSTNIGEDRFTGGQWETEFCLDQSIFIKSGEDYICVIQGEDQVMAPQMEANAALISQAKNMYQALQAAQSDYKFDGIISEQTAKQIREVLAKANPQ